MQITEGIHSPPIFRLWAGLVTIAGVLQRRVYTYTEASTDPLYPNLYVILAGSPATGKSVIIRETKKLWSKINGLYVASDNFTKASFIAELQNSPRAFMNWSDDINVFCSLAAPVREFGVFVPRYDTEFLSVLSDIFDNLDKYTEPRISVPGRSVDKPGLNIIAGVVPDTLGDMFPEIAWSQGFTARFIFIYSEVIKFSNASYFKKRVATDATTLVPALERFFDLGGEFEWSSEAQEAHIAWLDTGQPGAPDHSRLRHYATRRSVQLVKLAMISSVSAGRNLYVDIEDYERAHEWLAEAEAVMPDVFRAMG
jgi:hypothetical protein